MATANNEHEKLSFHSEALPPFAMTSYGAQATDAKNPLGLIEDSVTITPGVTAPIAVLNSKAMGKLLSETSDPAGRLIQMVGTLSRATLTSTVSYDSLLRRRSIVDAASAPGQKGTALIGSFSYDLLNRATSTDWDGNRDEFFNGHFSEDLSYDAGSNITQSVRELGTLKYAYDAINELTSSSFQNQNHHDWDLFTPALNRTWKYDLTGNRIQDSLRGTGDFIANGIVSDKLDNFKSDPDGFGNVVGIESRDGGLTEKLGYRADGKLTHFEAGWEHGWFFGGVDKFKTRYLFDALGRRIAKQHGFVDERDHSLCDLRHGVHHHEHFLNISYSYLGNQDKVLLAKDAGNEISLYLDGDAGPDDHLGEIRHGRARGYVKDHLGSVMNSAASGGVALFGAFGEMVGFAPTLALVSEPALYGYGGRQLDPESGLYYMRARMYSPSIGRFLSPDPKGFGGQDTNLYRYVFNNPLTFVDPAGTDAYIILSGIHTVLVVNNPNNYNEWMSISLYPAPTGDVSDLDLFLGATTAGVVVITPGAPTGGYTLYSVQQPPSADQALIDQALQLQAQYQSGQLNYNLYGLPSSGATQCTGFAAGLISGSSSGATAP